MVLWYCGELKLEVNLLGRSVLHSEYFIIDKD